MTQAVYTDSDEDYWADWDHLVGPAPRYTPDPARFRALYHAVFEAAVAETTAAKRAELLGNNQARFAHKGAAEALKQVGKMFEPLLG